MKLIIDVPEDTYLLCKSLPMDDIQKAIANGTPYEEKPKYFPPCEDCNKKMEEIRQAYDKMKAMEKPQGDLISRDALIKAMEQADMEAIDYEMLAGMYEHLVRNAPTVDTTCPNCDSGYAQGYSDGYLKGEEENRRASGL